MINTLGYLDPNQIGLPLQVLSPLLAAGLSAIGTGLIVFWRYVWSLVVGGARFLVRIRTKLLIGLTCAALLVGVYWGGAHFGGAAGTTANDQSKSEEPWPMNDFDTNRRVIVLGMDGLDPQILEALMDAGELPAMVKLREKGRYAPLGTTIPPESPVVWSSFATGLDPAGHGLFDFIHRDPSDYSLELSLNRPARGGGYVNPRQGEPFWHHLAANGVQATALFAPCSFPPNEGPARVLAGMGTPDLQGSLGRYTLISTDPTWAEKDLNAELIGIAPGREDMRVSLPGPRRGRSKPMTTPLEITRNPNQNAVAITVNEQTETIEVGQWTPWMRVRFKRSLSSDIHGICRFYLRSLEPELNLYCSPIQFDPATPVFDISAPADFAPKLAEGVGPFATLGLPVDTKAFEEGALDAQGFQAMAEQISAGHQEVLMRTLDEQEDGLVFAYFNSPDPVQHMFWTSLLKERLADKGTEVIPEPIVSSYKQMDRILADVQQRIQDEPNTSIIVLSDHGFADFRRAVELNRVLEEFGYLALKDDVASDAGMFKRIDWAKTQAYACGFSSIYLNLRGREGQGIVAPEKAEALRSDIRADLLQYQDPQNDQRPFVSLKDAESAYEGPPPQHAPDLIVGMRPGYRVSWTTALGGVGRKPVTDNDRQWAGGHIVDRKHVPGVLLVDDPGMAMPEHIQHMGRAILKQFKDPDAGSTKQSE